MKKKKISNHQFMTIVAGCLLSGTIIIIANLVTSVAKQDAWISAIIAPIFGIPVVWIYWFLGSRYPDLTFIGIIKKILGKWVGLIVSIGLVFLWLEITNHVTWYVGSFLTEQVMPETPKYIINLLFIIAVVIAILYGIEAFARACEILVYFASILFIVAMVLVLPDIRIENLQPIFEEGITPSLKGSLFLSCYITFPLFHIMMVYPVYLDNFKKAKKSLFVGYFWCASIVFIGILVSVLVLGSNVASMLHYPVYSVAQEISVGTIFTRLEFIVAASWLITLFIVTLMIFYSGVVGLSELLGLKDHKKIVIPLGLICSVLSNVVFPNTIYQANWDNLVWVPYGITFGLILPITLLIVYTIKNYAVKKGSVLKFRTRN